MTLIITAVINNIYYDMAFFVLIKKFPALLHIDLYWLTLAGTRQTGDLFIMDDIIHPSSSRMPYSMYIYIDLFQEKC